MSNISTINGAFPEVGVNLNTKTMQDLMAAHNQSQPWVANILKADRVAVTNGNVLNPANSRNNAYGLLTLGVNINPTGWQTDDGSVAEQLKLWTKIINDNFPPQSVVSLKDMQQIAVNLDYAAGEFEKLLNRYLPQGELDGNDPARLKQLIDGFRSGAAGIRGIHDAWAKAKEGGGPDRVDLIELNFQPQSH